MTYNEEQFGQPCTCEAAFRIKDSCERHGLTYAGMKNPEAKNGGLPTDGQGDGGLLSNDEDRRLDRERQARREAARRAAEQA